RSRAKCASSCCLLHDDASGVIITYYRGVVPDCVSYSPCQEFRMQTIPDEFRDLLERPIVVSLATVMPQGAPQVNPVWADLVDGKVRINTVTGRQKHRNLIDRRDVTVLVI